MRSFKAIKYTTKTKFHWTKKRIFEHYREIQTSKHLLIDIIFVMKKNSDVLFRVALYRHMLVLHKAALFQCNSALCIVRHDTQHNGIWYNDTLHNDTQRRWHSAVSSAIMLRVAFFVMLNGILPSVVFLIVIMMTVNRPKYSLQRAAMKW